MLTAALSLITKIWQTTQMPIDREWLNTATVLMEGGNTWDILVVTIQGWARETMDLWWIGARETKPLAKKFCYLSENAPSVPIEKHCLRVHLM